ADGGARGAAQGEWRMSPCAPTAHTSLADEPPTAYRSSLVKRTFNPDDRSLVSGMSRSHQAVPSQRAVLPWPMTLPSPPTAHTSLALEPQRAFCPTGVLGTGDHVAPSQCR